MKMIEENIEFYADGLLIKGALHLPDQKYGNKKPALVVGSHGLEGSKNSAKQRILSRILPENNIGFLRFDHRGCGESDGDFLTDTSVPNRAADLINAVKYIAEKRKIANTIGIMGSSLGGSTCIEAWQSLIEMNINLAGCVLCAAPVKSSTINNVPVDQDNDDGRPSLPLSFYVNNLSFDLTEKIKKIKNVLIVHGKADEVVPVRNAHIIYDNALDKKKLILFENGDHQTSSVKDQKVFEHETLKWFKAVLS